MFKKTLLTSLTIVTIAATANAQINKGALFLGGNIGFSAQDAKDHNTTTSKNTNFNISPAFGKAVRTNLVIGFDLNYGYTKTQSAIPNQQKTNSYGAALFVRQYKELGKGFYLFGQGRIGGSYLQYITDYSIPPPPVHSGTKGFSIDAGIYPGIAYALSNKLQLETGFNNLVYVNYNHQNNTGAEIKTNSFAIGSSLSTLSGLTIGFRVLFN